MARTLVAITGASSGIGEAFARKLAPEHDLLLIARRADRLNELASEFGAKYSGHYEALAADLTVQADLGMVADRLENAQHLGLLVNNAGFGTRGLFWEAPYEWQKQMHELHVMATLRLTHAALRNMVPRDWGAVINVASVAAFIRRPGSASYGSSKTWVATFTEALYAELKATKSDVRVQALCPGYTYSEFHDKLGVDRGRLASPSLWHSAEFVVNASLDGLNRNKLFVVPGWRYRLMTALVSKMPSALRLRMEAGIAPKNVHQLASGETK